MQSRLLASSLASSLLVLVLAGCGGSFGRTPSATPTALLLPTVASVGLTPASLPTVPEARSRATAEPTPAPSANPQIEVASSATPASSAAARIFALGAQPWVELRSLPDPAAPIIARLPGSRTFWIQARSEDGAWLAVVVDDSSTSAWLRTTALRAVGDWQALPVITSAEAALVAEPVASLSGLELNGRVNSARLNVRSGPGTTYRVLSRLAAGEELVALGRSDQSDWLEVRLSPEGNTGWVASRWVSTQDDITRLPVTGRQSDDASPANPARLTGVIVFQSASGGDIYLVQADGGGLRVLTTGLDPALSPDGSRLVFTRWTPDPGVYLLDLETGQEERIAAANRARSPTWSSDGERIAFGHATRDYICRDTPLGCVPESVLRDILGGQDCGDTPLGHVCIADFPERRVDDNGLAQITVSTMARLDILSEGFVQSTTWRPNSEEITYRSEKGLSSAAAGSGPRVWLEDSSIGTAIWSPDGARVAVQLRRHDNTDLFLLDASGGEVARLTGTDSTLARAPNNVSPSWSPDGRHLLFLTDRDGVWRLYVMRADGSEQQPLLPEILAGVEIRYGFAAERVASWGPQLSR